MLKLPRKDNNTMTKLTGLGLWGTPDDRVHRNAKWPTKLTNVIYAILIHDIGSIQQYQA